MATGPPGSIPRQELVDAARGGDEDVLLRAWRGLHRFEGPNLLRPWLDRLATDVCPDALARRAERRLPTDEGPELFHRFGLSERLPRLRAR